MATIRANPKFDAEAAAKQLKESIKGEDSNADEIIKVIATHNNAQRQTIVGKYKSLFDRDLMDDLKSNLGSTFEAAVIALMLPPTQFLAHQMQYAIKAPVKDELMMIEILCPRSSKEIQDIQAVIQKDYGLNLELEIAKDNAMKLRRLLVSECRLGRSRTAEVNKELAVEDAKKIFEAGDKRFVSEDGVFCSVMCERSFSQLAATFEEYKKVSGKDITRTIEDNMSGVQRDGYLSLVQMARNLMIFYAKQLHRCRKDATGTNDKNIDNSIIRIVVSHSETDLVEIAKTFENSYKKSLRKFITEDYNGDLVKLLLQVLGNA